MKLNKKINIIIVLMIITIFGCTLSVLANDTAEYEAHGHKNPKWEEFVKEGFKAYDSGNLASAEMFLQRAIARGCDDGLVYMKIGLYYEALKNYDKALNYFTKAQKKLPKQYPNHELTKTFDENMGRVLFVMGQKDKAEPYLKKAADGSENFTSLYFLGQYYREKGEFEEAIPYFERAFVAKLPEGMSPNIGILIMIELGKASYELKKFDVSEGWWDKILSVEPNNPVARSYKDTFEKARQKEREQKVLKQIVQ